MPTSACASPGASFTPVADHAHDQSAPLHFLHLCRFVLWKNLSEVFVKADLLRDPFGRLFVVARKHHAADVHVLERGEACLDSGRTMSASTIAPSNVPLMTVNTTVFPWACTVYGILAVAKE
jgi:hypothetical protein